jgi:hypothetical protein
MLTEGRWFVLARKQCWVELISFNFAVFFVVLGKNGARRVARNQSSESFHNG